MFKVIFFFFFKSIRIIIIIIFFYFIGSTARKVLKTLKRKRNRALEEYKARISESSDEIEDFHLIKKMKFMYANETNDNRDEENVNSSPVASSSRQVNQRINERQNEIPTQEDTRRVLHQKTMDRSRTNSRENTRTISYSPGAILGRSIDSFLDSHPEYKFDIWVGVNTLLAKYDNMARQNQ